MSTNSITGEEYVKQLLNYLRKHTGSKADIAAWVYRLIQRTENKEAAFRYFLENADRIGSSREKEAEVCFTASELQKLAMNCGQMVSGILDNLVGRQPDAETFYAELWRRGIESDTNFADEKEKIYALFCFWSDGRTPYFQLEKGLYMSEEDYAETIKARENEIRKAGFILSRRFSQKTERSSLLMRVLDSCVTEEEKAVVLAQILSMLEDR